jgi:hypothetical protein
MSELLYPSRRKPKVILEKLMFQIGDTSLYKEDDYRYKGFIIFNNDNDGRRMSGKELNRGRWGDCKDFASCKLLLLEKEEPWFALIRETEKKLNNGRAT